MINCSVWQNDFVLIKVGMDYHPCDFNIMLDYITNIKDYTCKYPIFDVADMAFPNIYTLEIALTIYKTFEIESKMVIINASRNYKKAIKTNSLSDLFTLKADAYDAIKYYKSYMFRKLWNV